MPTLKVILPVIESEKNLAAALGQIDDALVAARSAIYDAGQSEEYTNAVSGLVEMRIKMHAVSIRRFSGYLGYRTKLPGAYPGSP